MFFYFMFNYANDESKANVLPDKKTTLKIYFGSSDVSAAEKRKQWNFQAKNYDVI